MSRLLGELDRLDRGEVPAKRGGRLGRLGKANLIFILSSVLVLGLVYAVGKAFPGLLAGSPAPGPGQVREPAATGTGPYAFMITTPSGRPVGYDPCRPIHYVVNPAGQPPEASTLIQDAVGRVSAASGLNFIDDGPSQGRPIADNQGARYRPPGAPVLIAWANPSEYPAIGGDVEGEGGSVSLASAGPESARYVTGQVVLNRDGLAEVLSGRDGYVRARAIAMHELGHLVGLDHVNDDGELMAPHYTGLTGFGPGDRQGLAALHAIPCQPGN